MRNNPLRQKLEDLERIKLVDKAKSVLYEDCGKEALDYLKTIKGLTDKIIKTFSIGYVPPYEQNINGDPHEFAGRIIIPIYNQYRELIALSSRDWRENAYQKFFHETFEKKFYLFGLNYAKNDIVKRNKTILVEGEADVMVSHQFGLNCTVGLMGSAPQIHHISLLSRYCREIYTVLDGDTSGRETTKKILKMEKEYRFQSIYDVIIIPVYLPEKKDPDDFLRENGVKSYINLLKEAKIFKMENKK